MNIQIMKGDANPTPPLRPYLLMTNIKILIVYKSEQKLNIIKNIIINVKGQRG